MGYLSPDGICSPAGLFLESLLRHLISCGHRLPNIELRRCSSESSMEALSMGMSTPSFTNVQDTAADTERVMDTE